MKIYLYCCLLYFFVLGELFGATPKWALSKVCEDVNCAIGVASIKEGETVALARALKELRLMLGSHVQAKYSEITNQSGQSTVDSSINVYAPMQNIGYTILERYEGDGNIYVKIQYDANKKLLQESFIPAFDRLGTLEKLCKDSTLNGYYCVSLANAYKNGENGLAKNDTLALKWFKKGCDLGTLEGCEESGYMMLSKDSSAKAEQYLKKACEGGLGGGCVGLAGLVEGITKQRDLYARACELNDEVGCAFMGELYEFGLGHLEKNKDYATSYYGRSRAINPYGVGAAIAQESAIRTFTSPKSKPAKNKAINTLKTLCNEHNNARACAYIGDINNDKILLEKAAALGSPKAYLSLAKQNSLDSTKKMLLEESCKLGLREDFSEGCFELTLFHSKNLKESKLYAKKACNHIFYTKKACEFLAKNTPKECKNEEVCEIYIAKKNENNPKQATQKTLKANTKFISFGAFGDMYVGVGGLNLDRYTTLENSRLYSFGLRIGAELRTNNDIPFFIAPYIGYSTETNNEGTPAYGAQNTTMKVVFSQWNIGGFAGILYRSWRFFGIFNYGIASKLRNDTVMPIKSMIGYGVGVTWDVMRRSSFDRDSGLYIGVQYLYNNILYYGSKEYQYAKTRIIHTDTSGLYKTNNHVFMLFVGIRI